MDPNRIFYIGVLKHYRLLFICDTLYLFGEAVDTGILIVKYRSSFQLWATALAPRNLFFPMPCVDASIMRFNWHFSLPLVSYYVNSVCFIMRRRGQRPEARGQRPEARGQRPEARLESRIVNSNIFWEEILLLFSFFVILYSIDHPSQQWPAVNRKTRRRRIPGQSQIPDPKSQ